MTTFRKPPSGPEQVRLVTRALVSGVNSIQTFLTNGDAQTPLLQSAGTDLVLTYTNGDTSFRYDVVTWSLGVQQSVGAGNVSGQVQGRVRLPDGSTLYDWFAIGQLIFNTGDAGVRRILSGQTAVDSSFLGNNLPSFTDYRLLVQATGNNAVVATQACSMIVRSDG